MSCIPQASVVIFQVKTTTKEQQQKTSTLATGDRHLGTCFPEAAAEGGLGGEACHWHLGPAAPWAEICQVLMLECCLSSGF